jgi:hypothetical protein
MYNPKDTQFVGKHDFDADSVRRQARDTGWESFSFGVFKWGLKSNGKQMKPTAAIVRIKSAPKDAEAAIIRAEQIVSQLDAGTYSGPKTVTIK